MKITLEDAERLNDLLPTLAAISEHLPEITKEPWIEKFLRRSGLLPIWSWAYLFTTPEILAIMSILDGSQEDLIRASQDGTHILLDSIDEDEEGPKDHPRNKRRNKILLLACLCALSHTARAIGLHSSTMDELIDNGLDGDDLALRRAVAIDPTVLSLPTVNAYISWLLMRGGKAKVRKLYDAARNGPNKQLVPNWRLRYMERVLREGEVLELHSHEEVYKLVVERMHLHGKKGDSFKSLFTAFARWRKESTT